MNGQTNRAIGLWESWQQKEQLLMEVFSGSVLTEDLGRQKYDFLTAGMHRISRPTADEKLVLQLIRKSTGRLEKHLYPSPVLRALRKLKSLIYDRPVQAARMRKLKNENILSLARELDGIGVGTQRLNLDKRLGIESPRLDIPMVSPFGTTHNFGVTLHLEKDQSGAYELKNYTAELKDPVNSEKSRSYTFDATLKVSAREAANLLQGRAVMKHFQAGENRMESKWLQLDFKQLNAAGKPQLKEMTQEYGFDIRQQLIAIASALDKWDLTSAKVLDGLQKGNQVALTQVTGQTTYLEANAMDKQVLIRDKTQKTVKLESLVSQKKNQLEGKSKTIKLSKTRSKQPQQLLGVS